MKKYLFVLLMMGFIFGATLFADAKIKGIDNADEIQVKLEKMRAVMAADGDTFEIGMTEAFKYPIEQLCSFKPEFETQENVKHFQSEEAIELKIILPSSYTGYCGTVRTQNNCASSWAFSIIGAIEAKWRKVTGVYYDFSEKYLLDCNTKGYECINGGFFDAFDDCVYPNYFKYESCYPITATPDCDITGCDADYCSGWSYVDPSTSMPSVLAIKRKIYDNGAVAAGVYVDTYFQAYVSGCFSRNTSTYANHAVVLCGWNDSLCDGQGAWLLKNCWGTNWGLNGYMWIKYGVQKVGYAACYPIY